jgi:dihydroxyacetone kinase
MEMQIVVKEVIDYFSRCGFAFVSRLVVGRLTTSMEMAGIALTVFVLPR